MRTVAWDTAKNAWGEDRSSKFCGFFVRFALFGEVSGTVIKTRDLFAVQFM